MRIPPSPGPFSHVGCANQLGVTVAANVSHVFAKGDSKIAVWFRQSCSLHLIEANGRQTFYRVVMEEACGAQKKQKGW
jgi:hypothetical protein